VVARKHSAPIILSLFGQWSEFWQHFIQDYVDMLGFLWDFIAANPCLRIHLPPTRADSPHRTELLQLLGLESRVTFDSGHIEWTYSEAERLTLLMDKPIHHSPAAPARTFPIPSGLRRIQQVLFDRLNCSDSGRSAFFHFTRTSGTARSVVNNAEVASTVQQFLGQLDPKIAFESYDPGTLSLADSLRKICSAFGVLHVHGGALYHVIGLPRAGFVLELVPTEGICTTGEPFNLALEHAYFRAPIDGSRSGQVTMNIAHLRDILKSLSDKIKEAFDTLSPDVAAQQERGVQLADTVDHSANHSNSPTILATG